MISIIERMNQSRMKSPHKSIITPVVVKPYAWPFWAITISKKKIDTDQGVGDTLKRLIEKTGSDKIARAFEKLTGKVCGCTNRQEHLNRKYPY